MSRQAWSGRYELGTIPWDLGQPHPELVRRLGQDPTLGVGDLGKAYVPGAGRGHDAVALARAGWTVTGVDFAPSLGPLLAERLGEHGGRGIVADALEWSDGTFDLVFDHTFFCALDPSDRPRFGQMINRLLAPGGSLISVVFPIGRPAVAGGPPWGFDVGDVDDALPSGFRSFDASEPFIIPGRGLPHRWGVWRRAAPAVD